MSTTIRDINGNKLNKTVRHLRRHIERAGHWHQDSTGLYVIDYTDDKDRQFSAFVREHTNAECQCVNLAKIVGTPRP
jgi:hypothetical protein